MTNWNFNLSEAPRGKTVITTRLVADKKSQSGKSVRDIEEFRADPLLLATKCGKVIRGYYVPSEDRWAGFANGELPLAWQLWPEHPNMRDVASEQPQAHGSSPCIGAREAQRPATYGQLVTAGETAPQHPVSDLGLDIVTKHSEIEGAAA